MRSLIVCVCPGLLLSLLACSSEECALAEGGGGTTADDSGQQDAAIGGRLTSDAAPDATDGATGHTTETVAAETTEGGGGEDAGSDASKAPDGYPDLLFSDEFDGDSLDIGIEDGTVWAPGWIAWNTRHLSGNSDKAWKQHDEEQGWTDAWQPSGRSIGDALRSDSGFVDVHGSGPYNHEVSQGTLKMRAFRVPEHLRATDFGGFEFTGAMISTEDRFAFRQGYLVLRIRFTKVAMGMHFAFWTLSQDKKSWEADYGPEIDPLEVLSRNPNDGFERPVHWHQNAIGIPTRPGMTGYPHGFYVDVQSYDAWHTIGLERSPDDMMRFYVDGVLTREENVSQLPQYRDERHYVLATWEVGGNWPGEVTSGDPHWVVEAELDYVRVYGP